jgi:hypothetical protein
MKLEIGPRISLKLKWLPYKEKPKATKCRNHRTISLIAHTAKIVARILTKKLERKIEYVHGEDKFG